MNRLVPRFLGVAGALVALACCTFISRWSPALIAQALLGATAVAGLAWWMYRVRPASSSTFRLPPRLNVVQRAGLGARSGLVLVEVDGQPYLIVHGETFANVHATPSRLTLPGDAP